MGEDMMTENNAKECDDANTKRDDEMDEHAKWDTRHATRGAKVTKDL